MVQKYQSPVRVYKYPFELLMKAYEMRFPTCEMIPIVRETEILEETEDDVTGLHVIDRRAKLNIDAPYLLKKLMGVDFLLFRQRNTLDRRQRTLTIDAWNESFANRVVINEVCIYSVHPENPEWTCFEQSADLDLKNFFGFEGTAEKLAIKEYSKSIGKSKDIMEHYIHILADEGITHVPVWKPPAPKPGALNDHVDTVSSTIIGGAEVTEPEVSDEQLSGAVAELSVKAAAGKRRKSSLAKVDNHMAVASGVAGAAGPTLSDLASSDDLDGATAGFSGLDGGHLPSEGDVKKLHKKSVGNAAGGGAAATVNVAPTANSNNAKLEQDYIQMYLGELTPMQESKLVQLKAWVSELLKGKVPSDPVFLRFLRARDFNLEKAREMLSQSLIWRKKHGVDRILSEYKPPPVIREYFPGGWWMHDDEDRPLFILRLGNMDVKGIIKSVGEEGLTKLTLHVCEEGLRLTEEASHKLNRPISTWSLLLDLEGLNMRHLWRPGMKALLHIIEICEANYPETLGRVFIIRAPRVFPIMWTLVSPLIDETSRGKFLFYGGNDYRGPGGITDYIDPELLPDFLGGPRATHISEGGLVPKSYYMSVEEFEKDQSPGPHLLEDSFYNSATVSKGQVHEGVIHNSDKGSVITWDFDVIRHDVIFTVYRLKIPLPFNCREISPQPSPNQQQGSSTSSSAFSFALKDKSLAPSSAAAASTSSAAAAGTAAVHMNRPLSVEKSAAAQGEVEEPSPEGSKLGVEGAAPVPEGAAKERASRNQHEQQVQQPNNSSQRPGPGSYCETVAEHKSVLERHGGAREGVDYFKVEASIVCHDGESIQGSHVTSHVGTYVLQWRFYDQSRHHGFPHSNHMLYHRFHHHPTNPIEEVIDSLKTTTAQHKAKIMYFYEVLSSADYRGSMTSLLSCQSALSGVSSGNRSRASRQSTSGVSSGGNLSCSNHSAGGDLQLSQPTGPFSVISGQIRNIEERVDEEKPLTS